MAANREVQPRRAIIATAAGAPLLASCTWDVEWTGAGYASELPLRGKSVPKRRSLHHLNRSRGSVS